MNKTTTDDFDAKFYNEEEVKKKSNNSSYKIIIADDEDQIHQVTKMILTDFEFEGKSLKFIDTYSGAETIEAIKKHPDTAILFLDVVMESTNSGLEVVKVLRNQLKNYSTRIVLRTGQPGEAPEEEVIRDYDINDYRLKTELTMKRLLTTLYSTLRNYRDLIRLEKHKKGLEKIIETSAKLFEHDSLHAFLVSILDELGNFYEESDEMIFIRKDEEKLSNGFVTIESSNRNRIVAATGKYEKFIGNELEEVSDLEHLNILINDGEETDLKIRKLENGFIISTKGKSMLNNYIYVESNHSSGNFDYDLINLFLSNFSIALDNHILNNMLKNTQKEIIFALGETIESHFQETGSHVKRIAEMMYQFSLCTYKSNAESQMLKLASTMHDLGKIAIPDEILKKPGLLDADEFEIMKTHTEHSFKILGQSELPILKTAAEIALYHHEKFDGSGYPNGISMRDIPLSARMMSIIDVYDAMTHKRIYKEAISEAETLEYLISQKGKHFDPELVDLFISNLKTITKDVGDM